MVATILAAQCTDARVNQITPVFFNHWPDISTLAQARQEDVQKLIRPTGFFRNKAKNLIATAKRIMDHYSGQVPNTMEDLLTLPGVARKTANIVLSNAFGINAGIAVDTHVKRLSQRLGLTCQNNPDRIEQDLIPLFPQEHWGTINHLLVSYGREVCKARKPKCEACELSDLCQHYQSELAFSSSSPKDSRPRR